MPSTAYQYQKKLRAYATRWCDAALCACAWRPELLMGASLRSRSAMLVLIVVEGGWFVAVANPGAETADEHRSRPKKRRVPVVQAARHPDALAGDHRVVPPLTSVTLAWREP